MPAQNKDKINLLPQKGLATTTAGRILLWILSTFRIIVIVTEIIVMIAFLSRFVFDAQNTDLTDEIKQKQAVIAASMDFEKEFKKTQNKLEILSKLTKNNQLATQAIKEIGDSLPPDVFLSSVTILDTGVNFKAISPNEKSIQQVVVNLQESELFSDVQLKEVTTSQGGASVFDFGIEVIFQTQDKKL